MIRWARRFFYLLWVLNTGTMCWWLKHFHSPAAPYFLIATMGAFGVVLSWCWLRYVED